LHELLLAQQQMSKKNKENVFLPHEIPLFNYFLKFPPPALAPVAGI
jgi:hypothetical protein